MRNETGPWWVRRWARRIQSLGQFSQRTCLVVVSPELAEGLIVRVEGRPEGLDRQRKHVVDDAQTAACGEESVGDEGGSAGGSVEQRQPLLVPEIMRLDQRRKQVCKSEDLTGASVASQRNRRERPAVEQRCDGGHQRAADGGMTVEQVREARGCGENGEGATWEATARRTGHARAERSSCRG